MMPAPESVHKLVQHFKENEQSFASAAYNETQLRREFLDPFFQALGWDIENQLQYSPAYKDVIHEDSLAIDGGSKAPDYSFRVGGSRKFFVEAKRPHVRINDASEAAYQLRSYGWSAKLPLSLLTNFSELSVYDCRIPPKQADRASTARIALYSCTDYLSKWDEIYSRFSKEAVLKGYYDQFAETNKQKRGTAEFDSHFLEVIEGWRSDLASNIALRNPSIDERQLNFAVQRSIDRIIFLRICEDRGIEPYGQLRHLAASSDVYSKLKVLFERADEKYNSGLFHFAKERDRFETPDELTLGLTIDDARLKQIFKQLYYPESPYQFSVVPADLLGHVYEQFLGKTIHLTEGHRAKIEPKLRKESGVYYTPTDIVKYVVSNTVGEFLKGKTIKQAAGLKIVDPACGSGSFLIAAYEFLLDWYRDAYLSSDDSKTKKLLFQTEMGWNLASAERKSILLRHIFGVDIDSQAVEVTKLSLLLKVLEDESEQAIATNRRLFQERALPDLGKNIKCGNSLIGFDFSRDTSLFLDDNERYRINPFNWNSAFTDVPLAQFDVVIGNPPWGQKEIAADPLIKNYLRSKYKSIVGIFDLFRPFVEKAIQLTKENGYFGFVLPDVILLKDYPDTRKLLLDRLSLSRIDWWGMAFKDAVIDAATIIGIKNNSHDKNRVAVAVRDPESPLQQQIPQSDFHENDRYTFNLLLTPEKREILKSLQTFQRLGESFEIHEGVHSGNMRDSLFLDEKFDSSCQPMYFGRDEIHAFSLSWQGKYISLAAAANKRNGGYCNAGTPEWYEQSKLLVRRTGDFVLAAVDEQRYYASNNFFIVFPKLSHALDLHGLCALLNSQLMTWFFRTIEPRKGRVFAELKIKHIETFPLPGRSAAEELNRLGKLGAQIANQQLPKRETHGAEQLERTMLAFREELDRAVLMAFGLSEENINGEWSGEQAATAQMSNR